MAHLAYWKEVLRPYARIRFPKYTVVLDNLGAPTRF